MWLQQGEAQAEVWGREDGERFHEDVGDGFVAGEVWVELVSARKSLMLAFIFDIHIGPCLRRARGVFTVEKLRIDEK